ncbi:hypothetical protein DPQ33_15565 [Oceanidesulfovibrio indonesiensis]|uniref:Motility protein n=2 Tax=Oceanidesulfovibrio indonesiensis TaxID=54767 RepID=A0A7M3MB88_9BACT|nr:hypothetical protein DPQ33_15565 [Oceanidesulfovibrio indonesiensis]
MAGLANALESQKMALEVVQRPMAQGQEASAAAELRANGPQKPSAPLATGHAVAGIGKNIDITV